MNTRMSAYLTLFSVPTGYVILKFAGGMLGFCIGILILLVGLVLGIITCRRSVKIGDRASRNIAIGGIILNTSYLALLVYMIFYLIPDVQRLAIEMIKESKLKQQQEESASHSQVSPSSK